MESIEKLLQKEMDRKEFLQFSGSIILVILGLGNLVSFVRKYTDSHSASSAPVTTNNQHGFGSRKFGA